MQKTKAIVTPSWLRDSVAEGKPLPCDAYVAFPDLRDETVKNCPSCKKRPCLCEDTDFREDGSLSQGYPSPPSSTVSSTVVASTSISLPQKTPPSSSVPENLLAPLKPIATNVDKLSWRSRYACQRASPLICPNQALAVELDIIRRSRALEGEERSALSYARAISAIKGRSRTARTRLLADAKNSLPSPYHYWEAYR